MQGTVGEWQPEAPMCVEAGMQDRYMEALNTYQYKETRKVFCIFYFFSGNKLLRKFLNKMTPWSLSHLEMTMARKNVK